MRSSVRSRLAPPKPNTNECSRAIEPLYPTGQRVLEAREAYLRANGLSEEGYTARSFVLRILGVPIRFPSTAARRRVLPLHDLHHIATGYRTDWIGEAEMSAWELRAGCNSLFLFWINGAGVTVGMMLSPRRVWNAFRAAHGRKTLYREPIEYETLLAMTVGELRRRLGIPQS